MGVPPFAARLDPPHEPQRTPRYADHYRYRDRGPAGRHLGSPVVGRAAIMIVGSPVVIAVVLGAALSHGQLCWAGQASNFIETRC